MSDTLTNSPHSELNDDSHNIDFNVDAKGLKCPMPVIKLQQQVRQSPGKSVIQIDCTDPGAEKDIRSWVKVNKHEFLSVEQTDFGSRITICSKE